MKKISFIPLTMVIALGLFCSAFSPKPGGDLILDEEGYIVFGTSTIEDEGIYSGQELVTGRYGGIQICPGSGVRCVIRGRDTDGDPTVLIGTKGKGRENVEFNPW